MKLTPRQQTFLDKLFELYGEFKGPVHYSVVADKLGVNKFSAYDMLKVLEEKGVAASDYVLSDEQAGPGRSQVVFYPTHKAAQFLTQLRDEMRYNADWQRVKERILHAGVTSRIGLGSGVLILPYRPKLPTAKQIATVQELSGGRLLLGRRAGSLRA